jgi:hypothetical protein
VTSRLAAATDALALVRRNADAAVLHVEPHRAVLRVDPHAHGTALVAVPDRVVHQDADQTWQQGGVADHRRFFQCAVVERHASALRLGLPPRQFVGDHIVQKQRLVADRGILAGGIGARELQ